MVLGRLLALLVVVILGSIAGLELFKFLMTMLPILIILAVAFTLCGGSFWMWRRYF